MPARDRFDRPLRSLRISVTDRCNLRCQYCMPEEEYVWLPRGDILTFEEIGVLVDAFTDAGADRVRLTGGEPLLRKDLPDLIERLAQKPAIRDLALTTNGMLLADQAAALRDAGLHRLTVSLDTLDADRFRELTRFDGVTAVQHGLAAAREAGFTDLKIDTVVIRGVNDDELVDLLAYGRQAGAEVRFIEYMDVGGATRWSVRDVLSRAEMLRLIGDALGPVTAIEEESSAPGRPLPAAGRPDVRHHLVDHRAVLPLLRPQPPDRRRPLVPLPLRPRGHRPARPAARRRVTRGADPDDWRDLDGPHRPRGRGPACRRQPRAVHPGRDAPEAAAPGDAHAGRVARRHTRLGAKRRRSVAASSPPAGPVRD